MTAFDSVSAEYQSKALVQQAAASRLIDLLQIDATSSVLDVACGPGHVTDRLRTLVHGSVVGTDISPGMIDEARSRYPELEFRCVAAEELDYVERFDIAFCNSALVWFAQPEQALRAIARALKPGGRIGVSNPATSQWSPWLLDILSEVTARPEIQPTFARWKSPWFFLPTEEDYRSMFERCGFITRHLQVEREAREYPVEKAFDVYLSGPANGLTCEAYYACPVDEGYIARFNGYVREAMERDAVNGRTVTVFNRLYYVGEK